MAAREKGRNNGCSESRENVWCEKIKWGRLNLIRGGVGDFATTKEWWSGQCAWKDACVQSWRLSLTTMGVFRLHHTRCVALHSFGSTGSVGRAVTACWKIRCTGV